MTTPREPVLSEQELAVFDNWMDVTPVQVCKLRDAYRALQAQVLQYRLERDNVNEKILATTNYNGKLIDERDQLKEELVEQKRQLGVEHFMNASGQIRLDTARALLMLAYDDYYGFDGPDWLSDNIKQALALPKGHDISDADLAWARKKLNE